MKTIAESEQDILHITMKINREYPELSKYIPEMPVKISEADTPVISVKNLEEHYNSLVKLVEEYSKTHAHSKGKSDTEKTNFPGYPLYPPSEDIYNQGTKEKELNPDDLSENKPPKEKEGSMNEKGFDDDMSGDDLDVPGSELDDQQESVGSEDEENNYYSVGGDEHNNLDEDKG